MIYVFTIILSLTLSGPQIKQSVYLDVAMPTGTEVLEVIQAIIQEFVFESVLMEEKEVVVFNEVIRGIDVCFELLKPG